MKVIIILICYMYLTALESNTIENNTLKLVHIIFRHGDRTPLNIVYPNNPFMKKRYPPYGFGQLTNKGKQRAYNLGKWIRQRYDNFLNRMSVKQVSAVSTYTERAKSSLALVLAGLYPPKGTPLEWNTNLNWNPINFQVLSKGHSLLTLLTDCKPFFEPYKIYTNSKSGQKMLEKYDPIAKRLAAYTNLVFNSTFMYFAIYDLVSIHKELGINVPKWMDEVLPILEYSSVDYIKTSTATKELTQISVGHLLKKIVDDTTLKLNNTKKFKSKKMYLYSAHDFNIGCLLQVINPKVSHKNPPYSSCLILEIHTIRNVSGVKVFYQPDVSNRERSIHIHKCGKFCPLNKFTALFEEYFTTRNVC